MELAKISKGTFYHYFSHKMELLESIVNPNETAALIVQLITYMQERFVEELVKIEPNMQTMNNIVRICQQCIERLLAIPEGSLIIFPAGYIGDYMDSQ